MMGRAPAERAAPTSAVPYTQTPRTMSWTLSGSVGRWERNAQNRRADVETIQKLLTAVAGTRGDPRFDPGGIDGRVARPPASSGTVRAIEAYQRLFLSNPDGLVSPNGQTFRRLVDEVGTPAPAPGDGALFYFPFRSLPLAHWSWMKTPRSFGANRSKGRAHAGCDLYYPLGTTIHAITDGVVVRHPSDFYCQTDALEVDHGPFIARYGEIQRGCPLRKGDTVKAGQPIAKVGHLVGISVPCDMLHLELYDKSGSGPLTVNERAKSRRHTNGRPFYRRSDLMDPTPLLNQWKSRLAP